MGSLLSVPNMGRVTAGKLNAMGIRSREEFFRRDP